MNSTQPYSLFGLPVSRRAFFWSLVLSPGLALVILLSTWSRAST